MPAMSKRILLAALFGGIIMFAWGYVSHAILPLGKAGISKLPDEAPMLSAITPINPGFYVLPYSDMNADSETRKAHDERWAAGPSAILVKQPQPGNSFVMRMLLEFGSNVICAWLLALILTACGGGFVVRASMGALIGLYATFSIDVSQWNWFGFPRDFTLAAMIDQTIGAFATAVVVAAIVRPRE